MLPVKRIANPVQRANIQHLKDHPSVLIAWQANLHLSLRTTRIVKPYAKIVQQAKLHLQVQANAPSVKLESLRRHLACLHATIAPQESIPLFLELKIV